MHLIIDTATNRGLIALGSNDKVISYKELALGLANSRQLEPSLQQLLAEAGIAPKDLEYVAVGQGPGSYTGLRVGAACAKAIAIGCEIPLVGLRSLRGFLPPTDFLGSYLAVIDAKIGGVYVQEAIQSKEGVTFLSEEKLMPFDQFVQELKRVPYIATPTWDALAKRLEGIFAPTVFETGPSAKQLLAESNEKFVKKEYTMDGSLPLLYLRLTQAEMEKLPNKGQLQ